MSLLGLDASRSSAAIEVESYNKVAAEYYDERLHPTCADFRAASRVLLTRLFETAHPNGRIADIGCGCSVVAEFTTDHLVLIDHSPEMLAHNIRKCETRVVDVEAEPFGWSEFDWVFAILADPFNSPATWRHIARSMKAQATCVFVVPSCVWSNKFRFGHPAERPGYARFVIGSGESIYLRSSIFRAAEQRALIERAGLSVIGVDQVLVRELPVVRSSKISDYLEVSDPVLDVYFAKAE
jgi:hypothetical protein